MILRLHVVYSYDTNMSSNWETLYLASNKGQIFHSHVVKLLL